MATFEIFRTGRHTAMNGAKVDFTTDDLARIAEGFDRNLSSAPLLIGHPDGHAQAYGWVDHLSVVGDRLVAQVNDVSENFIELVRGGRYKNVSASFYAPRSAGNPTPGRYYLRHVGFLGAQAPAVKGLRPVSFTAGDGAACFAEPVDVADPVSVGMAARRLMDRAAAAGGHLSAVDAVARVRGRR